MMFQKTWTKTNEWRPEISMKVWPYESLKKRLKSSKLKLNSLEGSLACCGKWELKWKELSNHKEGSYWKREYSQSSYSQQEWGPACKISKNEKWIDKKICQNKKDEFFPAIRNFPSLSQENGQRKNKHIQIKRPSTLGKSGPVKYCKIWSRIPSSLTSFPIEDKQTPRN